MSVTEGRKSERESDQKLISRTLLTAAISASLRMFIPVFGLFLIGLLIDSLRGETAFFAIFGAIFGFVVAIFLIYLQVKKLDTNVTKAIFATEEFDKEKTSSRKISAKNPAQKKSENSRKSFHSARQKFAKSVKNSRKNLIEKFAKNPRKGKEK